jgi:hypothetical protein
LRTRMRKPSCLLRAANLVRRAGYR